MGACFEMRIVKIGVGVLVVSLAVAFFRFMLRDTWPEGTVELMEALQEAPVNSIIRLSDYLHVDASEACLLTPYQDSVSLEESQHATDINREIEKRESEKNYLGSDDGLWNLVLWKKGNMDVIELTRPTSGDIKSYKFEKNELSMFARSGFSQKICSDFVSSGFIKFKINGQMLFTFGGIGN